MASVTSKLSDSTMSNVATELVTTTFPPSSANGGHSQHPTSSEDGLGYSRHYAQRIRDLGKTSKESWIKRLWNHMFGNTTKDEMERAGGDASFPDTSSTNEPSLQRKNSGERRNPPKPHSESAAPKEVRFKEPDVVKPREDSAGGSREDSHSAPLSKSRPYSAHDKALEGLPVQLLNSPYLPPKDRIVFYQSQKSKDGVKSRYMNPMSKSMTALGSPVSTNARAEASSLNPHRQSHPYFSQLAREGTSVAPKAKVTRDASVIQLEKRAKALSDKAIKVCHLIT